MLYKGADYDLRHVKKITNIQYDTNGKIDSIYVDNPVRFYPHSNYRPFRHDPFEIDTENKVIKIAVYNSKADFIAYPLQRIEKTFERLYAYTDITPLTQSGIASKLSNVTAALQKINLSKHFLQTGTIDDTMTTEIEAVIAQINADNAQATGYNHYTEEEEFTTKIKSVQDLIINQYNVAGKELLRYNLAMVDVTVPSTGGKKKTHSKRL